jgi:hypothetical protein
MSVAALFLTRSMAEQCTEIYFVVMKVFVEPVTKYCKETDFKPQKLEKKIRNILSDSSKIIRPMCTSRQKQMNKDAKFGLGSTLYRESSPPNFWAFFFF